MRDVTVVALRHNGHPMRGRVRGQGMRPMTASCFTLNQ